MFLRHVGEFLLGCVWLSAVLNYGARLLPWWTVTIRSQHDDPGATAELPGSWHWASSEFQVDGKDGAIEPSWVAESPERKITPKHLAGGAIRSGVPERKIIPKHLAGGALWSYRAELLLGDANPAWKWCSLDAAQSRSFFASETWETLQGQFRDLTTCHPSFFYKKRYPVIRVKEW